MNQAERWVLIATACVAAVAFALAVTALALALGAQ